MPRTGYSLPAALQRQVDGRGGRLPFGGARWADQARRTGSGFFAGRGQHALGGARRDHRVENGAL